MTKNYDEVFVKRGTKTNYEIDFVRASYIHFLAAVGYDGWMLSIPFKTLWIFTKNKLKVDGQNNKRSGR